MLKLEKYDSVYLEKSWEWLADPETKMLTNTPDFTKEEQLKWFEEMPHRENYKIWGASFNEIPIGIFGIKNINLVEQTGEYWGFIGEKEFRGKGFGHLILEELLQFAQTDLKLKEIHLKVIKKNKVAIHLYKKMGFKEFSTDAVNSIMKKNISLL